jgi:hypothetical protein
VRTGSSRSRRSAWTSDPATQERPRQRPRRDDRDRPFHVAKAGSDALDEVRCGYWNELRQSGDQDAARRFKGARWALIKRPENLTDTQTLALKRLRVAGGEVWRAYTLKEALRAIFAPGLSLDDVQLLLERFISRARRSPLQPLVRLAATIARHRDGILAAIALGVTTPAPQQQGPPDRPTRLWLPQPRRSARADHAQLRSRRPTSPTRTSPTSMTRDPHTAELVLEPMSTREIGTSSGGVGVLSRIPAWWMESCVRGSSRGRDDRVGGRAARA